VPTRTRPPQTALLEEVDGNTMATMMAPLVAAQCCRPLSADGDEDEISDMYLGTFTSYSFLFRGCCLSPNVWDCTFGWLWYDSLLVR